MIEEFNLKWLSLFIAILILLYVGLNLKHIMQGMFVLFEVLMILFVALLYQGLEIIRTREE